MGEGLTGQEIVQALLQNPVFVAFMEEIPGIWMGKDVERDIVLFCSQKAARMLGYKGDYRDIWGTHSSVYWPDDAEAYRLADLGVFESGETRRDFIEPFEPIDPTKPTQYLLTTKMPCPLPGLKLVCVQAADITDLDARVLRTTDMGEAMAADIERRQRNATDLHQGFLDMVAKFKQDEKDQHARSERLAKENKADG